MDRAADLLHHQVSLDGPMVRIAVGGEIDFSNADLLDRVLTTHVRAAGAGRQVLVDLSAVEFCAAGGARVLREAMARARARSVELRMHPRSAAVDLVLDICGWREEVERGDPALETVVRRLRR
jgi:anti-anti-sigma factor